MLLGKPDIVHIIEQEGIELKRGKALCPFHAERTPSFMVNQKKQTFHCYGCGAHGDIISFIMKLKWFSFKDALSYLGIRPGSPAPIDPSIQRQRNLQQRYEKAITDIYNKLCERSRHLHRLSIQVKNNPSVVTAAGAVLFAEQMGKLAEIDHKLDVLLAGTVDDQISILREAMKNDCTKTISRAA